jgi:archaellum biogenesis protein FlaJ (TadC family)
MKWFYVYANVPSALRTYAFEVWEGYYVGLYLSVASAISFIVCLLLAILFEDRIAMAFAILSLLIFLVVWAVRHWHTVPRLMHIPAQQIGEIVPSGEVLNEARRRFG